jgi:hypothetical protein
LGKQMPKKKGESEDDEEADTEKYFIALLM